MSTVHSHAANVVSCVPHIMCCKICACQSLESGTACSLQMCHGSKREADLLKGLLSFNGMSYLQDIVQEALARLHNRHIVLLSRIVFVCGVDALQQIANFAPLRANSCLDSHLYYWAGLEIVTGSVHCKQLHQDAL